MASSRKSAASSAITLRQQYQCCGNPCSSTTGGASSGPACATWARTPVRSSCQRCSTPGRSGGSVTGGRDHLLDAHVLQVLLRVQEDVEVAAVDRRHAG